MLNCAEQMQIQKYLTYAYKTHKKQHLFKQSCSKIQLSSKDGYKKEKRIYP